MAKFPKWATKVEGLKDKKEEFKVLTEFEIAKLLQSQGYEFDIHDSVEVIDYVTDYLDYVMYNENDEFLFVPLSVAKEKGTELFKLTKQ